MLQRHGASGTRGHGLAVSTTGLVHIYRAEGHDVAALSGVDLGVAAGEMVGLLGPSGAGKSTLLTLFGGLLRASAGKIHIGEHELSGMSERELDAMRAKEIGLILQGAGRNLVPYLNPLRNVEFAQQAARRLGAADLPTPREIVELVGLYEHSRKPLTALTPGHLQLAAVAVAISAQPGLLLGDEPTSQLDHEARDNVLAVLERINAELGSTIIVVTHDPDVARQLPRTVTIRDGRVGSEGRSGQEYAVVSADGSLPLPVHVLDTFPPGTLLRVHEENGRFILLPEAEPSMDTPLDEVADEGLGPPVDGGLDADVDAGRQSRSTDDAWREGDW